MTVYDVLYKGFKKWYGVFIGMHRELLVCEYRCDFYGFWEDVQELKMDSLVIDTEPPKIIGLAGLEGITYSKWEVIERLKNKTFSDEYRYFTLSTSQYDEMFLLYGYKTKNDMLKSFKLQKKSHDFYISIFFKV